MLNFIWFIDNNGWECGLAITCYGGEPALVGTAYSDSSTGSRFEVHFNNNLLGLVETKKDAEQVLCETFSVREEITITRMAKEKRKSCCIKKDTICFFRSNLGKMAFGSIQYDGIDEVYTVYLLGSWLGNFDCPDEAEFYLRRAVHRNIQEQY